MNFLVALTTPILLAKSSSAVYFLFGGSTFFTVIVCIFFMPETRGRTLENIDESIQANDVIDPAVFTAGRRLLRRIRRWIPVPSVRSHGQAKPEMQGGLQMNGLPKSRSGNP